MNAGGFFCGVRRMFGFFVVTELNGEDAQGAAFLAKVKSQMNEAIRGTLYLPPYLRPNQCNIETDSVVWGCLDEVTGRGFAMFGKDGADFGYFFNADIEIQKTLTVKDAVSMEKTLEVTGKVTAKDAIAATKDITSNADVKAGTISLKNHTHAITAAQYTGTIDPTTGTASGTIAGDTEAPTGA